MISQPVFSIFPCSPLPSGTCRTPGLSIPWCCLPTSSSVCLVFFPLSLYSINTDGLISVYLLAIKSDPTVCLWGFAHMEKVIKKKGGEDFERINVYPVLTKLRLLLSPLYITNRWLFIRDRTLTHCVIEIEGSALSSWLRLLKPSAWGNFSLPPTWRTSPTGCGARPISLWSTGTSSGNCHEMETCMVWACHMPQQPLQNHPSGHLGGWAIAMVGRGNAGWRTSKNGHPCPY